MIALPLRWRIIAALIGLAVATTLALSFLARYYLDQSLKISVNLEMGRTLTSALSLAKENYDARKKALHEIGQALLVSPDLAAATDGDSPERLRAFFEARGRKGLRFQFEKTSATPTSDTVRVFKSADRPDLLQLRVPIQNHPAYTALVVSQPLDRLLEIEGAVHTYKHLKMEETDLRRAFLLAFLVTAAGVVLTASLLGIRIGFGITHPLYALIKGTREMARDNLAYRIPKGRDDEIGLLIESFNRMAEDLKVNRRKRLEAEQIAAWREIARRLAHEIKNPLTPIQLTVQQLRDKYDGADPAYRQLVSDCTEIVAEEVENLRELVQEFADFARMPSLSLSQNDLNAAVQDVVRLYPDIRLRLELAPELPPIDLDVEQMRRVIINLIENGIDAGGPGGTVAIRTHLETDVVVLSVCDNGPGVALEDRQRIFQPYVSAKESGMGLGLAVVRSVVEDHGGRIIVGEAPEGGAQFDVHLPLPENLAQKLEEGS